MDQYNNTYHHYITKKSVDADFSGLTEKIAILEEAIETKSHSTRIFLAGVTLQIGPEKHLLLILFLNLWTYKIEDLRGEKIIDSFYDKELLRSIF